VAFGTLLSEGVESAVQGPGGGEKWAAHGLTAAEAQKSIVTARELTCQDFEWVSTWRSTSSTAKHGGRASLAFLQANPEESRSIHVVL
jgi:hypothetical protein